MPGYRFDVATNGDRPRQRKITIHTETWRTRAACRGIDPEHFHPDVNGAEGRRRVHDARQVCTGCEVRLECLAYAIAHNEDLGIWGGTTERQRRAIGQALRRRNARTAEGEVA